MKKKITIECKDCKGTGLYKGMGERGNCAVICSSCQGSGSVIFEYEEFFSLQKRYDVKRVFKGSFGYVHSDKDTEEIEFSKGGCSYTEWLKGEKPKPIKNLYCPYMWRNQNLQDKDKNNLYKNFCSTGLEVCGLISNCKNFLSKEKCWEVYEKE